jgi:hypothetical protein
VKLSELADRIRQLEDALEFFAEQHPLLNSDLRQVKDPYLNSSTPTKTPEPSPTPDSLHSADQVKSFVNHVLRRINRSFHSHELLLLVWRNSQLKHVSH